MQLVVATGGCEMKDEMETVIKEESKGTEEKSNSGLTGDQEEAEDQELRQVDALNLEPPQDALLSTPAPSTST